MKYHFRYYLEDDGYWAKCCEIKGCQTEADTMDELIKNCEEVLELMLDEPEDSGIVFPPPDPELENQENILAITARMKVAS